MGLLDALKVWGPDKSRISPASLKVDEGFKPADFSKWGVKNFNELKMKDLPEYLGDRARWSNSRTLLPRFGRWYGFHFNGGNEGHYRTDIYKTTGRKIAGSRWVHAFLLCTAVHITMKNMFRPYDLYDKAGIRAARYNTIPEFLKGNAEPMEFDGA